MAKVCKKLWRHSSSSVISRAVSKVKQTSEELTGHSDVLQAQLLVRTRKEELREWRQKLAEFTDSYEQVQRRLKGLYTRKAQVYQDQRRDLAAIQAVNDEEESLLQLEQSCFFDLENCQQKERECFESLSDAIQESHEKERAKTDQMKYYSCLGSLLGAVFGFLGSNLFLRREFRQHNVKQAERMESIESALLQLQKQEIPVNKDISQDGGITSSFSQQDEIKLPVSQKNQQTLTQAETKLDELSEAVKRNSDVLDTICTHLRLQFPCAAIYTPTSSELPQDPKSRESHKGDVVALGGVVAYSIVLALFSMYR